MSNNNDSCFLYLEAVDAIEQVSMEIYYVVLGTSRVIKKIHKSLTFTRKQLTEISNVLLLLALILIVTVPSFTTLNALESQEKGAYTDNIRFIQYLDGNTSIYAKLNQGILTHTTLEYL